MNCPHCHQPLADGKQFCSNCGCPVDAANTFFDANALGTGIIDVFTKKYCCFRGRARRKEYWMSVLFVVLSSVAAGFAMGLAMEEPTGAVAAVSILFSCATTLPMLALAARRYHDMGRRASEVLWVLITATAFSLFEDLHTLVGTLTGDTMPIEENLSSSSETRMAITYLAALIVTVVIGCFDSQPGPNKYGPNPKGK